MRTTLELLLERDGERVLLSAPDAGVFTDALPRGAALAPGQAAGTLLRLGRPMTLVAPAGARGTLVSQRPERVHEPVGYRTALYELIPFAPSEDHADADAHEPDPGPAPGATGLVLRSPQSGRFYHRPALDEPPFASPGDVLTEGAPVGLIEVMKTFTHVPYRARDGLPERARVLRVVAGDGADVVSGDALVEVEPA